MTHQTTIRLARPADSRALAELRWEFKRDEYDGPPLDPADPLGELDRWIHDSLAGGRWLAWVAEDDGVICGHVFLQSVERMPEPTRTSAPIGYVTNFYVVSSRRDRGVGSALLQALDEYTRTENFNTLVVWPSERSAALYRRAGYQSPAELLELPFTAN
ncbi:MAG: GNAT family N-acetyltransferase [Kibdelosporangium sp.]